MTRLIKKYKNRRLYDMETSQYITVEQLQAYVTEGILFRVEDATTHKDITSTTLLQIFVEMESTSNQFLSSEMLRQLILLASHPMNQAFKGMLEQFFNSFEQSIQSNPYLKDYQKSNEAWQQQFDTLLSAWKKFL